MISKALSYWDTLVSNDAGKSLSDNGEREAAGTPEQSRRIPARLPPGEVQRHHIEGEEVVIVGAYPAGLPVLLSPTDWQSLLRWKLDKLSAGSGHVRAFSAGCRSRPLAARVLTNTVRCPHRDIRYRNGNALDLRRTNIAVVPRHLLERVKREAGVSPPQTALVKLRDGRVRRRRQRVGPNAATRLRDLLGRAPEVQ